MKKYFFEPWVGDFYAEGLKGLRTLVVGDYHICTLECGKHAECSDPVRVRDMDTECPCYCNHNDRQYYRLGNSNNIEIQSFIDKEAAYPAYKAFTCYMLKLAYKCPTEERKKLWDKVAFTNFLQHFVSDEDEEVEFGMYEAAYGAFLSVVDELKPQVIFAWNPNVNRILLDHEEDFRYVGKADMGFQLEVHIFTPTKAELKQQVIDNIRRRYNAVALRGVKTYRALVDKYMKACFVGNRADRNREDFADTLKLGVREGLLCHCGDGLCFNDEPHRWKVYHKAYFVMKAKQRFYLAPQGTNDALNELFNCSSLGRDSFDSKKHQDNAKDLRESDPLLFKIKNWLKSR